MLFYRYSLPYYCTFAFNNDISDHLLHRIKLLKQIRGSSSELLIKIGGDPAITCTPYGQSAAGGIIYKIYKISRTW